MIYSSVTDGYIAIHCPYKWLRLLLVSWVYVFFFSHLTTQRGSNNSPAPLMWHNLG